MPRTTTTSTCLLDRACAALALCLLPALTASSRAAVTLDGTFGRAGPVPRAGGQFAVSADLGASAGKNLFFSFAKFDLARGQVATFSAPPGQGVTSVVARVTGGASSIDGTLRSTIPAANFFLIDPAGVALGPDARLDVGGSFAVATANSITFADGVRFSALARAPALSTAAPVSFGFLKPGAATVVVSGALAVRPGRTLAVAGGGVRISGGRLQAAGGVVSLTGIRAPGAVPVFGGGPVLPVSGLASSSGVVALSGGSIVTTNGDGGGVSIRAGRLMIRDSAIHANVSGASPGAGIDAAVAGDARVDRSSLLAVTNSPAAGGPVRLSAANVALEDSRVVSETTLRTGGGDSGGISIACGSLSLTGSSAILSRTQSTGSGGSIDCSVAGAMSLSGNSAIGSTVIVVASGDGGRIDVAAGSLSATRASIISSSVFGRGRGGDVRVAVAGALDLQGGNVAGAGGIASTLLGHALGRVGNLDVRSGSLTVGGGDSIDSSTFGFGPGGNVDVRSGRVTLDGSGTLSFTGVGTNSEPGAGGPSGHVVVRATDLAVLGGATISAATSTTSAGGNVRVVADTIALDGMGRADAQTGILADTNRLGLSGAGGGVFVRASSLSVSRGAQISTDTTGTGAGGNISLVCGRVKLDGGDTTRGLFTGVSADTFFPSGGGDGGRILIRAGDVRVVNRASVQALSEGSGSGGATRIEARSVEMRRGGIIAGGVRDAGATAIGNAGSVTVTATGEVSLKSGAAIATSAGHGDAGGVTIHAGGVDLDAAQVSASAAADGGPIVIRSDGGIRISGATAVRSETIAARGTGKGSDVSLAAGGAVTLDGATVSASALGRGVAGGVSIQADGGVTLLKSKLAATASVSGGNISVDSRAGVRLLGGTSLRTDTTGTAAGARGGGIFLGGGALRVGGKSQISTTAANQGSGGRVVIRSRGMVLSGGSLISSSSTGSGNSGTVRVATAGPVRLSGGATISTAATGGNGGDVRVLAGSTLELFGADVTAEAASRDAGNIFLASPSVVDLVDSRVTTSARGAGGDISIDPTVVVLVRSRVLAQAVDKSGGNITIRPDALLTSPDSVISASSVKGVSGLVQITTPDQDLAGSLARLSGSLVDVSALLQPACAGAAGGGAAGGGAAGGGVSSFIQTGSGGLGPAPGGWVSRAAMIADEKRRKSPR